MNLYIAFIISILNIVGFSPTTSEDPFIGTSFSGKASYYGVYLHGRKTANGEIMDKNKYTCAHKTLPFGTMLEVRNPVNQKSVILRVNDRGPYTKGRILDISYVAAKEIEMIRYGVITVEVRVVGENGEVHQDFKVATSIETAQTKE